MRSAPAASAAVCQPSVESRVAGVAEDRGSFATLPAGGLQRKHLVQQCAEPGAAGDYFELNWTVEDVAAARLPIFAQRRAGEAEIIVEVAAAVGERRHREGFSDREMPPPPSLSSHKQWRILGKPVDAHLRRAGVEKRGRKGFKRVLGRVPAFQIEIAGLKIGGAGEQGNPERAKALLVPLEPQP
jgi:hypothetical protein